jgi:hypothetical protein
LYAELRVIARDMESHPTIIDEHARLAIGLGVANTPATLASYARVKLAFEATRDSGLWHVRWAITNQPPSARRIFAQWQKRETLDTEAATAVAECDELSALFAVVARELGVREVGLFWPTWNHAVAVWTVAGTETGPVRVVVPTSQIFLSPSETLGTPAFDPWKQKTIYAYRAREVPANLELPAALARFFVEQARKHAVLPQAELQRLRNERSQRLGGS